MRRAVDATRSALLAVAFGIGGAATVVATTISTSPVAAVMVSAGLVLAGAVMLFPTVGLVLTAFVVPIERFGRFGGDSGLQMLSLMRIVGTLALGSILLNMILRRLRPVFPAPMLLYGALVALATLSLLWVENSIAGWAEVVTMLGNLMFLFLITNGVRDWATIQRLVLTWLFATVLIAIYQAIDWHIGSAEQYEAEGVIRNRFSTTWDSLSEGVAIGSVRRAMGTTSNSAVYGINLILTVPFFLYWLKLAPAAWMRGLAGGSLILVLYNMLLTNTRAVMLFGALALALCVITGLVRVSIGRLVLALCLMAAIIFAAPEDVWRRVLDAENYTIEKASNLRGRFELWRGALHIFADYWPTGIGIGNRTMLSRYIESELAAGQEITPHNELLQILVELGLPGGALLVCFVASVCLMIRQATAIYRTDPDGRDRYWFLVACQVAVVSAILFSVQVDVLHFPLKGWWLILGVACVLHRLAWARTREPARGIGEAISVMRGAGLVRR